MGVAEIAFISMPGGMEWLLILLVALLVFGKNLPKVMRDLGSSVRTFKEGMGLIENQAPPKNPFASMSQVVPRTGPIDQEVDNLLAPQRPQHPTAPSLAPAEDLESDPPIAAYAGDHGAEHTDENASEQADGRSAEDNNIAAQSPKPLPPEAALGATKAPTTQQPDTTI